MKRIAFLSIAACLLLMVTASPLAAQQPQTGKLRLTHNKAASYLELVRSADLIVLGHIDNHTSSYPTGVPLGTGQLVNYVQPLRVQQKLKGLTIPSPLQLLTDGVEPLPKPSDPLNLTYTGPIAQGEYMFFLRKVPGTNFYALVGQWQGIYPVLHGKLIAVLEGGFQQFMGLTVPQVKQIVDSAGTHRIQTD